MNQLAIDPQTFPGQPASNSPPSQKGILQMHLVDPSRQGQIRLRESLRLVGDRGSVQIEQFALLLQRQSVRPVYKASALLGGYRPGFSDKKARSRVICPILAWGSLISSQESLAALFPLSKNLAA